MRIKKILMISILFLSIVGCASATVNIYPVTAISDTKILPATDMSGYTRGNTLTIRASPGEITCGSFVINSDTRLNDLSISVSNLIGNNGTIPAENVDLKWVKCWYQGGYQISWDYTRDYGYFLTGELLLNDDSLVNVIGDNWNNYSSSNPNGVNYLKLGNGSYINITTGASQIPQGATIQDATIIQPLDLAPNYNKQVWVTFNVPTDIAPGTYTGIISIKNGITTISTVDVGLQVLPITLLPSTIEESVDYLGKIDNSGIISADNKSEQQYTAELLDMKRHGITNPVMVQTDNATMLRELAIRQSLGMDNSNLYLFGTIPANNIQAYKNTFALYGVENLYLYGPDEQDLTSHRSQIIDEHNAGGKHFNGEYVQEYMENNADVLDLLIAARTLNYTLAYQYHKYGHKIYSYLNPQTVPEYPRTFRLNYGLLLWQNDYDGAMDFAYQFGVGNIWDDFGGYRDFAFAYPTSTTPVDTIQFEGQREASNDLRYLSTLQTAIDANPSNNTTKLASAYLQSLKTKDLTNTDLDSVRTEIANYIIMIQEGDPIVNIKDGSDNDESSSDGHSMGTLTIVGSSDSNSDSSSSSSDSSSSGGAGVSPEPQSNVEAKELSQTSITYGNSVNFNFPQNATPVTNISFDSKKTVGKTTAIVEMLINQSTLVSEPPSDEVYKFVNIWIGNSGFATPDNIENATVYFKVEKSWLQDKNIDKSSITFNRYNDTKWNPLQTTFTGEDDQYLYSTAETLGFSSFAITGKTAATETVNETESNTQDLEQNNSSTAANAEQVPEQTQSSNTSENGSKSTPGFEMIYGIAGLVGVSLYRRR